jgi:hypothetical protein
MNDLSAVVHTLAIMSSEYRAWQMRAKELEQQLHTLQQRHERALKKIADGASIEVLASVLEPQETK